MKAVTVARLAMGLLFIALISFPVHLSAREAGDPDVAGRVSRGEMTQMLAPIALYPDTLLSKILMASTYPVEVNEAARWIRRYPGLTGTDLDMELVDMDWDPSVKSLCHFPSILNLMSDKNAQTTRLGNAFLAQEKDVMDIIQKLRASAYNQGNLISTSRQKVMIIKETIIIEPADPRVIYVPYYDPFYIYGSWKYSSYPPYYWAPSGVRTTRVISYWPGYYSGYVFGKWSVFDWDGRYIFIDVRKRPKFVSHDGWFAKPGPWHHTPRHRRGVSYHDKDTPEKYGRYPYYKSMPSESKPTTVPDRFIPLDSHRSRFQPPGFSQPGNNSVNTDTERSDRSRQVHDSKDNLSGKDADIGRKGGVVSPGKERVRTNDKDDSVEGLRRIW